MASGSAQATLRTSSSVTATARDSSCARRAAGKGEHMTIRIQRVRSRVTPVTRRQGREFAGPVAQRACVIGGWLLDQQVELRPRYATSASRVRQGRTEQRL